MCRWLAYHGSPITIDVLVTKPDHSLVDQSINARYLTLPGYPLAQQFRNHDFPTNGDGFGVAWLGRKGALSQFHQITPAWDSDNLRSLAEQIETSAVLAFKKLNERIEEARKTAGVTEPFTACVAASDGNRLVTMRVSSRDNLGDNPAPQSPSLFHASGAAKVKLADGGEETLPDDTVLVCSEPLQLDFSDHTWHRVEDRSITLFQPGQEPQIAVIPSIIRGS